MTEAEATRLGEMAAAMGESPPLAPIQGWWLLTFLVLAVVLGWMWLEGWHE